LAWKPQPVNEILHLSLLLNEFGALILTQFLELSHEVSQLFRTDLEFKAQKKITNCQICLGSCTFQSCEWNAEFSSM